MGETALYNPVTKGVQWVPEAEAEQYATDNGFDYASQEQVDRDAAGAHPVQAALESAARTAMRPGIAITEALTGEKVGSTPQEQLPVEQQSALAESVQGPEAKLRAEANPNAAMVGQMAAEAPALAVPGAATGLAVASAVGGLNTEAENAWREDRDYSVENAALNTVGGLLTGGALHGAFKVASAVASKAGEASQSLMKYAQERAIKEGSEDILQEASAGAQTLDDVRKQIRSGKAADPVIADLAENAPAHKAALAESTAKDLQTVRDGVDQLTKRTLDSDELSATIPKDSKVAQQSWALSMADDFNTAADRYKTAGTPEASRLGKALRSAASKMGESDDPAVWYRTAVGASEDIAAAERGLFRRASKGGVAADELQDVQGLKGRVRTGAPEEAPAVSRETPIPVDSTGQPVSLIGKDLKELSTAGHVGMKQESLDFLRQDPRFAAEGKGFHPRMTEDNARKYGYQDGIILDRKANGSLYLRDGRHRLTVGREQGKPTIFGRVFDGGEDVIYEGQIPIGETPPAPVISEAESKMRAAMLERGKTPDQIEAAVTTSKELKAALGPVTQDVQQLKTALRSGLEDDLTWGTAARDEARRYTNWQARLDDHAGIVDADLFRNRGGSLLADERRVARFLDAGDTVGRGAYTQWLDVADRIGGHATTVTDQATAELGRKVLAASDRLRGAIGKADIINEAQTRYAAAGKALRQNETELSAAQQLRNPAPSVDQKLQDLVKDQAIGMGMAALGHNPVLMAIPFVYRKAKMLQNFVDLGNVAKVADNAAVRRMIRPIASIAEGAIGAAGGLARGAADAGPRVAALGGSFAQWKDEPARYGAAAKQLTSLAKDPQSMFDHIGSSYADVASDAPEAFTLLNSQVAKTVLFLASKVPQSPRRGIAVNTDYVPSEDKLYEFSLYFDAATDPSSVRRALGNGSLKKQQVETLATVAPQRLAKLKLQAIQELQAAQASGQSIAIGKRMKIDMLLGGAGDPAFSDAVASNVARARLNKAQQEAASDGASPSSRATPPSVETANAGASVVLAKAAAGAPA